MRNHVLQMIFLGWRAQRLQKGGSQLGGKGYKNFMVYENHVFSSFYLEAKKKHILQITHVEYCTQKLSKVGLC